MIVYFLRHASAGKSKADPAQDDQRPLDAAGVEQSQTMGRLLARLESQVDEIISSPLQRARETASLVAGELGFKRSVLYSPVLAKEPDFKQFRLLLKKYGGRNAIMVVGHNPSLSQFLSLLLSAEATDAAVELKKGAIASVEITGNQAALKWCATPKLVRAAYESRDTSSRPKTSRK